MRPVRRAAWPRIVVTAALVGSLLVVGARAVQADEHCDVTPAHREVSPYAPDEAFAALGSTPVPGGHVPRGYVLSVPAGLPDGPVPLVVAMHGLGGSGGNFMNRSRWAETAAEKGFVVAAPSGPRSWDNREASTDTGFVRDVIADVRARHCIDPHRIYAVGHSNGAMMALRLACDAGDLIAAATPYGAADLGNQLQGGPCDGGTREPQRPGHLPVPLAIAHGDADSVNAYATATRNRDAWVERYDCDTAPLQVVPDTYGTTEVYGNCARPDVVARGPFEVRWRILHAHDHGWPDGCGGGTGANQTPTCDPATQDPPHPGALEFNRELWAFLERHPRPAPAVEQAPPALDPSRLVAPADPDATADWATTLRTGADSTASLALLGARRSGRDVEVTLRFEVATRADPAGVGPSHPTCPTEGPGMSRQPTAGRTILVSLGDGTPEGTSAVEAETVVVDGDEIAVARLPVPPARTGPLAVRAVYAGDDVRLWPVCGAPHTFFKQTVNAAGIPGDE